MDVQRVAGDFRRQAAACERLGSPFYRVLLEHAAADLEAGGAVAGVLGEHAEHPEEDAVALRLAGTVHRLALAGQAPRVAAHFPSCGGDGDAQAAWVAVRDLLAEHADLVRPGLESAPQTNEVGRAAGLLGALLTAVAEHPLPVRLWEIGASGGLNLRADRFAYRSADGGRWGPESPVLLDPAWDRVPAGAPSRVQVLERVGGDLSPVEATTPEGELRLTSYVWPDQDARLARLRAAITVAREHPARLVGRGAAELVGGLELADGTLTVLWHSVMWQYLPAAEQAAVTAELERLGAAAGPRRPFAHIGFEPRRDAGQGSLGFAVTLRLWPGGTERVLGTGAPHGVPVTWA